MSGKKRGSSSGKSAFQEPYFIMGRNCVREALRTCPGRFKKIWLSQSLASDAGQGGELVRLAEQHQVAIEATSSDELTSMVQSESHQSCVAQLSTPRSWGISEIVAESENSDHSLVLLLDSIQDPQNFGTLLRVAECFDATGVVWSVNRGCRVTPVVSKAGVGASELVRLAPVSNLADAVRVLKKSGYWIVAAEPGEGSQELQQFEFPEKTALILGSEGKGIADLLLRLADFKVIIQTPGSIESLNVSQATSVFLYSYRRQFPLP